MQKHNFFVKHFFFQDEVEILTFFDDDDDDFGDNDEDEYSWNSVNFQARSQIFCKVVDISSVISNPASKIIQTDTSSVILRKHPRFSTIQKVGS